MLRNLAELLRQAAKTYADRPCVLHKQGKDLTAVSYREIGQRIEHAAAGLVAAGVAPGDRIILLAENREEWVVADGGLLTAGAVSVPLYPSLPANQIAPLVDRVHAKLAIVENHEQLDKLLAEREQMPSLQRIVVFDLPEDVEADGVTRWAALIADGEQRYNDLRGELDARVETLTLDDVATIIFTSGTTGVPKGAMLTHGNLVSNVVDAHALIDINADDRLFAFLPLSHIFLRMVTFLGLHVGASVLFNRSLRSLLPDMVAVRPTVLLAVPRFLETVRDRVLQGIASKQGLEGTVARWAMGVADQWSRAYVENREPSAWLKLQHKLADQRVFRTIRENLGLNECRFMVSGGAALPPELGRWFYGIGLLVCQGYGLTETSPAVAVNDPAGKASRVRFDTIGPLIPNVEVKIADNGELLVRGPNIMKGYFEMPEETAEAIDPDGWFHTGDLAERTPEGHYKITGRSKEILVLANGKNVSPVLVESTLQESPLIDRAFVFGDDQDTCSALLVPHYDGLREALGAPGATSAGAEDNAALVADPAAEALIKGELERVQAKLAGFERVRRFRLLPRDFSLDEGEITPTLKMRRSVILDHFGNEVQALLS